MNADQTGRWVKLPWGTSRVPPVATLIHLVMMFITILLLGLGMRWFLLTPRRAGHDPIPSDVIGARVGELSISDSEPFSMLFGLDKRERIPFVLLSTVLGPKPQAILEKGGVTFHVSPGDTVADAVVDSIGRGIVVLRFDGREVRVSL